MNFNTIPEALEDLRQGKIILVTDDPDRENEGDFICAAEFATTENINFMATHGKGLICMPMSEAFVRKLQFPQMVQNNTDNHETAFTVSIDHISTTTGISAAERSVTAMACVEEGARAEDFRRPGHMFPLLSKKNGVLEREMLKKRITEYCFSMKFTDFLRRDRSCYSILWIPDSTARWGKQIRYGKRISSSLELQQKIRRMSC